ncbi:MAG: TetR/AcrR family transcriptional regulator [Acidimicrobiia bacterium]
MATATLRADAARNRTTLVAAAREVTAGTGLEVPFDEIARRSGIGNATLYWRFPRRIDLIAAVFADRLVDHAYTVDAALEATDPWIGFEGYIEAVTELQVSDRVIPISSSWTCRPRPRSK